MPDSPTRSARIHTPKVPTNCSTIALGTSCTRCSTLSENHDSAAPATRLPIATASSSGAVVPKLSVEPVAAATATR